MGVLNWPLSNTTHGHLMASIGQQKLPVCVCVVSHDAAVQHLSCFDSDTQARPEVLLSLGTYITKSQSNLEYHLMSI